MNLKRPSRVLRQPPNSLKMLRMANPCNATKLGCCPELYARLRAFHKDFYRTPLGRYLQHKAGAQKRRIEFRLTIAEWWAIWEASGRWEQRGNQRGQYQMARNLDRGAYADGNVEIQTVEENRATQVRMRQIRRVRTPQRHGSRVERDSMLSTVSSGAEFGGERGLRGLMYRSRSCR